MFDLIMEKKSKYLSPSNTNPEGQYHPWELKNITLLVEEICSYIFICVLSLISGSISAFTACLCQWAHSSSREQSPYCPAVPGIAQHSLS